MNHGPQADGMADYHVLGESHDVQLRYKSRTRPHDMQQIVLHTARGVLIPKGFPGDGL